MGWLEQYLAEKNRRDYGTASLENQVGGQGPNYEELALEMNQKPMAQAPAQTPQADPSAGVMQAGMSGAAMGGPAGAAIGAGGSLITSYLAQKAADERARRDRAALIEDQYADNQDKGFNTQLLGLRGALR